jgi:hypothetical protein
MGGASQSSDMVHHVAQPLPQRKHAPALAWSRPVSEGVARRAPGLTDRRREGHQGLRELEERLAEAGAETPPRAERAQALGRAVAPIGEHPFDPRGRLMRDGRTLQRPLGLGPGCGTGVRGVAEMPAHPTLDHGGQSPLFPETVARLLIRQALRWQGQTTPGPDRPETVLPQGAQETGERHRGARAEDGPARQTEAPVCSQERITGDVGAHRAITQDAGREDREDGLARGALEPPEGEPTHACHVRHPLP